MNTKFNEVEYNQCVGCGLCEAQYRNHVKMKVNDKGFIRPFFINGYDKKKIQSICPVGRAPNEYSNNIWGQYRAVYLGSSLNNQICDIGSSGGIITQVLLYLLESEMVDGIIHIGSDSNNPLRNSTYVSKSGEEVIRNAGSRYSPSSPLCKLDKYLTEDMKYAFVGKPCDIRALKNYAKENPIVGERIIFTVSFFCAGTPSFNGTDQILKELEINKNDVTDFRYRGNGWPGYTTAITRTGERKSMTYNQSWGGILRKYVQAHCRWCADGVGEFADISCGDAWYLDRYNQPIFKEDKGRNVIFARSKQGERILKEMSENKLINIIDYSDNLSSLKHINYYQYYRKATMLGKILALKFLCLRTPKYKMKTLWSWSRNIECKHNIKTFLGTIIRKLQRKF